MAVTIQVKRGNYVDLPTLAAGEPGFCIDTKQLFFGDGTVNHEVVMKNLFDAGTLLFAESDNNPVAKTRAQFWALLSGQATAAVDMNSQKIINLADPENDQDAATKKWVATNFGAGSSTFVALTDTPANFTDAAGKVVRVNDTADALEFVDFATTWLEDTPSDSETGKAPTSNWAHDHAAATTGVHGAGENTLLHSGSVIDGGAFV